MLIILIVTIGVFLFISSVYCFVNLNNNENDKYKNGFNPVRLWFITTIGSFLLLIMVSQSYKDTVNELNTLKKVMKTNKHLNSMVYYNKEISIE
jgi:heme/copper-type cytochrome/quinol oxidase subunit 2